MAQDRLDKFSFWVPASLEKGSKDGQETMKIKGIASSATSDSDGETLLPSGFDYTPLLTTGFLNWDHQAKKTSAAIIGEPTHAEVVNNGKDFYIEGELYAGHEEAQSVYKLGKILEKNSKTRRLGFSIEGQVMERACGPEFFDEAKTLRNPNYALALWNKITKARITGVAITPCPKNPNTLMQIVKGETNNLLMEDEYEDVDLEEIKKMKDKAMSAEGMSAEGVLPEDIEGTKNPNTYPLKVVTKDNDPKSTVGSYLKKSEIYNLIAARYTTDVQKAKQIYTFIQSVTTKLFNMTEISKESIEKSFDFLNEAASSIVKSKSEDGEKKEEGKDDKGSDLGSSDTPAAKEPGKKDDVEKSEADKAEAERLEKDASLKKAKDEAHELFKKGGLSKGEMIDKLCKSGHSLEASTGAVESIVSQAESLKENGGQIAPGFFGAGIEKSLNEVIEGFGKQDEFFKSFSQGVTDRFAALGNILKSASEQNVSLKAQVDLLVKSNATLTERLGTVENQSQGRKSVVTTSQAVERFNKSDNGGSELPAGTVQYDLRKSEDRDTLASIMFEDAKVARENRTPNNTLEKAIGDLEISKSLPSAIFPYLRSKRIVVTNGQ